MPSYNKNPFFGTSSLTPGLPGYAYGSFDTHLPGWALQITNTSLTSDVATYTAKLLSGGSFVSPIPTVGALVTVIGSSNADAGSPPTSPFDVTAAPITGVSMTLADGVNYTGTFTVAINNSNITSAADACNAIVAVPEVGEAIANGSSKQWAVPSIIGDAQQGRSVTAVVTFPVIPNACTVALQGALRDVDSEYTLVSNVATVAGGVVTGQSLTETVLLFNFYRLTVSGLNGSGTIVGKLQV